MSRDGVGPVERRAEVVVLELEEVERGGMAGQEVGLRALCQRHHVLGMPHMDRGCLPACSKLARRVFADGFQHREAWLPIARDLAAQQAVLDEHREAIEHRLAAADLLGGFRGEAAGEHGQTPQQHTLALVEQTVAPVQGGQQGALALVGITRAYRQQVEATVQPTQQRARRKHRAPRRSQLDRQWQPVQP